MNLTRENYHSAEADAAYCNATQLKLLARCEAAWAARYLLKGADGLPLYPSAPPTDAMLAGLYLECILLEPHRLPALHQQYRNELFTVASRRAAEPVPAQPERLHKTTGKVLEEAKPEVPGDDSKLVLLAPYAKAVEAKEFLARQEFVQWILAGASAQVIHTGSICGVQCRTMLDIQSPAHGAVDLKYVADTTGRDYDVALRKYMPYWYTSGYHLQLAMQMVLSGIESVSLLVVDKRDPMGLDWVQLEGDYLTRACERVEQLVQRWYGLREVGDQFQRCGQCEWCRKSAVLGENLQPTKMEW